MTISKAIDLGRSGLSKSLMASPCERKGIYSETVRDAQGRRLSFPMPEKVTFGTAVDEAVSYIVWHDRDGIGWKPSDAIQTGLDAAREAKGWSLIEDPDTFDLQVGNAIRLFLEQPDGLARIRSVYPEGILLQGEDGKSLKAGDVIGTPDYMTGARVGDVKTWSRNDGERVFTKGPEAGIYVYLFTQHMGGVLPASFFYHAYIRVAKPYWTWLESDDVHTLYAIGEAAIDHWRRLVKAADPLLAAPNTMFCGDCPWALPMPEYGHEGCPVGRLMPREVAA